jgi:signal transduction histidine kinase
LIAKNAELDEANDSLLASNEALKLKVQEVNKSNKALLESDNNLALANKELAETNEKFAKVNKEFAAVNKELAVANKKIKQHDEMQKEFINIAAHELRTPIQPILGLSDILRSKIKDSEQLELLDVIVRNANRLRRLTNDILDVTKIESHTLKLNKERFNLNDVLTNAINDITTNKDIFKNNKKKNLVKLSLLYQQQPQDIFVQADKASMTQVISNLISNAVKFTKEGTISISLQKKREEEDSSDIAIISIKDTGIGISSNILPRLFSKFATGSSFEGGIGLGLFISKSIIGAHGGKIWAENNTDGKGATFYFSLPLSE